MEKAEFRCINCHEKATELHRDYSNCILKITICESCKKPVDKYIEYDPVVILIDAILCKTQAFRHILFNTSLDIHWKLCVFCLLCEAYFRWFLLHGSESSSDPADIIRYTKEWEFYGLFGLAALELSAFCGGVLGFIWLLLSGLQGRTVQLDQLLRALLLSCYGKVLLIPAVIWEHDYSPVSLALIKLLVLTSNAQAVRVILNGSRRLSLAAVCVGLLSETCVAHAWAALPWSPHARGLFGGTAGAETPLPAEHRVGTGPGGSVFLLFSSVLQRKRALTAFLTAHLLPGLCVQAPPRDVAPASASQQVFYAYCILAKSLQVQSLQEQVS
ncbi:protein ARV1 [Neosynchiropus ocellatus]